MELVAILSDWNNRQARKTSKEVDWFSTLKIFLLTSGNDCIDLLSFFQTVFMLKFVSIIVVYPWKSWTTLVFTPASTAIYSNVMGWINSDLSGSSISWDGSFPFGSFNCSWYNVCFIKDKTLFLILFGTFVSNTLDGLYFGLCTSGIRKCRICCIWWCFNVLDYFTCWSRFICSRVLFAWFKMLI